MQCRNILQYFTMKISQTPNRFCWIEVNCTFRVRMFHKVGYRWEGLIFVRAGFSMTGLPGGVKSGKVLLNIVQGFRLIKVDLESEIYYQDCSYFRFSVILTSWSYPRVWLLWQKSIVTSRSAPKIGYIKYIAVVKSCPSWAVCYQQTLMGLN